jgi:hypothetical protein
VHALHNIHAALASDAVLVDTQPLSERPPVAAGGAELGTLDMREWLETIRAVDALFAETVAAGLYELQHEERISVTDTFDTGPECLTAAEGWRGTQVPRLLASRLAATQLPVTVEQEVRLRLLRRGVDARAEPLTPRPARCDYVDRRVSS